MRKNTEASQVFSDGNIRVEKIIWLASEISHADSPSEQFRDFLDYETRDCAALLFPDLDEDEAEEVLSCTEEVLDLLDLDGRRGFLVQVATPIPQDFSKDGASWRMSWGYYQTKWLYVEAIHDVVPRAKEWAEQVFAVEAARNKEGGPK